MPRDLANFRYIGAREVDCWYPGKRRTINAGVARFMVASSAEGRPVPERPRVYYFIPSNDGRVDFQANRTRAGEAYHVPAGIALNVGEPVELLGHFVAHEVRHLAQHDIDDAIERERDAEEFARRQCARSAAGPCRQCESTSIDEFLEPYRVAAAACAAGEHVVDICPDGPYCRECGAGLDRAAIVAEALTEAAHLLTAWDVSDGLDNRQRINQRVNLAHRARQLVRPLQVARAATLDQDEDVVETLTRIQAVVGW